MKLADIKIPNWFSDPSQDKINAYEEMYNTYKKFPGKDPIRVNEKLFLIDGYIQYIILKRHGVDNVNVTIDPYVKSEPNRFKNTTIIRAHHADRNNGKCYIWRVTKNTIGVENLSIGSTAIVETSSGEKPVIVDAFYKEDINRLNIYVKGVVRIEKG